MAIMKVVLAGIKKRKIYSIAVVLLVLIMAVLLSVSISLQQRAHSIYEEMYKDTGTNHVQYFFKPEFQEKVTGFKKWFEDHEGVQSVDTKHVLMVDDKAFSFDGMAETEHILYIYPNKTPLMGEDRQIRELALQEDEVVLPLYFKNKYQMEVGESFRIHLGDSILELKVHSFYLDTLHGSSMISVKTAIIAESLANDLVEAFHKEEIDRSHIREEIFLGVVLKDGQEDNIRAINRAFYRQNEVPINTSYTKELYKAGSLYMSDMVLATIMAFSILLLGIIILVIRNAIHSSIETDYTNIGILKALGFTGRQIRLTVFLQYSILATIGMIGSLVVSPMIMPYVGDMIIRDSGIIWYGSTSVLTLLLISIGLLAFMTVIVFFTCRRVTKISPVRAISGGKQDVYFRSHVNIPMKHLAFLPLNIRLGLKQLLTRIRQYLMLMVISAVLIMVTGMILMSWNLFNDLTLAYKLFGLNKVSVEVIAPQEEITDAIVEEIKGEYDVEYENLRSYHSIIIDSESILSLIWEDIDQVGLDPLEGRFPKYDNEVSITKNLSKYYGKKIGDTLLIRDASGEQELSYIITSYHQYISNMGKNIFLTAKGYKRINPKGQLRFGEIRFSDSVDLEGIFPELEKKYKNEAKGIDIYRMDHTYSTVLTVKELLSAVAIGYLILVVIIISIVTMLQAVIVIHKENRELGIYKSLGYEPLQIRLQFAARFGIITALGSILGCILCRLFGASLLEVLLSALGIAEFGGNISIVFEVLSIGLLSITAYSVAFLVARRIKKVSSRALISE